MKRRVLFLVVSYHTVNFFRPIIQRLLDRGHSVRILALHDLPYGAKEDGFDSHKVAWNKFDWDKIEEFDPHRIVVFNGFFRAIHAATKILKKRWPTLTAEVAWLPQRDYIYIDKGIHHESSVSQRAKEMRESYKFKSDLIEEKRTHLRALREKYKPGPIPDYLPSNYVLVPLQLERDTSIVYASKHFKDMNSLVSYVKNALPDTPIVVKQHPKANTDEREFALDLSSADFVLKNEASMNDLSAKASMVVGINSTSLIEAMIHNKPVVQLGHSIVNPVGPGPINWKEEFDLSRPSLLSDFHKRIVSGDLKADQDLSDALLLTMMANQISFRHPPEWAVDLVLNLPSNARTIEDL